MSKTHTTYENSLNKNRKTTGGKSKSRKTSGSRQKSKNSSRDSRTKRTSQNKRSSTSRTPSRTSSMRKRNSNRREKIENHHNDDSSIYIDDVDIENIDDFEDVSDHAINHKEENAFELGDRTKERLKRKIVDWLNYDDKIKVLNQKSKKYKDAKKQQEDIIIKMISKLGIDDTKIDIHDNNNNLRSRVYKHKSVTKGSLKENIIKNALMEAIRDEKKVDQLVRKIESKRPINERYYLKRTKGNKND